MSRRQNRTCVITQGDMGVAIRTQLQLRNAEIGGTAIYNKRIRYLNHKEK